MRRTILLLVLLLLATGTASAAPIVAVDGPDGETLRPRSGDDATLSYTLRNRRASSITVFADAEAPPGWSVQVLPPNATVPGNGIQGVTVLLSPEDGGRAGDVSTVFTVFDRNASDQQQIERTVSLEPQSPPRVLGLLDNPLPEPLSGVAGALLLNVLAWTAIVVGVYLAIDPVLHWVAGARRTGDRIQKLLRYPVAMFLVVTGLLQTVRILPPTGATVLTMRALGVLRLLVGLVLAYRVFRSLVIYYRQQVAHRTRYEWDDVVIPLLEKVGAALFLVAGLLLLLSQAGVDVGVLLAAGGFASVIIGFAAQNTLSNFFSGINILLDQPFREGDDVQLETGEVCRVEDIGIRTTRLYHYRQHEIIIVPNNDLATKRVVNLIYPDQRYRYTVEVAVAYGSDTDRVAELLHQAADEHPEVISDPDFEPMVFFDGFGDHGLQFTVRFFITDVRERWRIAGDIRERIDDLFRENGITIPFPQRTHWFKSTLHHKEGDLPPPGEPVSRDAGPEDAPPDEPSPGDDAPDDGPGPTA